MKVPLVDLRPALEPIVDDIWERIHAVAERRLFLAGPEIEQFEAGWCETTGARRCIACSSGTDAVTLLGVAMSGQDGSMVTIPANCIAHTEIGLRAGGCGVMINDVTAEGRMMWSRDWRPLFSVGLYGYWGWAKGSSFVDGAQLHGWRPRVGQTVSWSFYPAKNLGAWGDAGAVTTDSDDLWAKMLESGKAANLKRMDEFQAAVLNVKLPYLPQLTSQRLEIARHYWNKLPSRAKPVVSEGMVEEYNGHLFPVLVDNRDELMGWLKSRGIGTKVHYPALRDDPLRYPGAVEFCDRVMSLPIWPGMTVEQIDHVCRSIADFRPRRRHSDDEGD